MPTYDGLNLDSTITSASLLSINLVTFGLGTTDRLDPDRANLSTPEVAITSYLNQT